MSPIRRYLRITKYSVLEVRIYLDKPSDAPWLLSSRDNVLERIIYSIKPKVLPKLREENENAKSKSASARKKRGIKDVVEGEDFEVSIFLQEHSNRHSLLTKKKEFGEKKDKLRSNGKGLTGWMREDGEGEKENPVMLEEDGENDVDMSEIPEAGTRNDRGEDAALFISSSDEDERQTTRRRKGHPQKQRRRADDDVAAEETVEGEGSEDGGGDDKKKLAMDTTYDGFSIYGWILCLVVKRKGVKKTTTSKTIETASGSQMMEQWVSTQAAQEADLEEDVEG